MLEIEIFSDVICPWCFIGKRRLDKVLATPAGEDVQLRWRPYQLYPNVAPEGVDRKIALRKRYGADADPGRIPPRLVEEADSEGIRLRYDLIARTPNTLLAHRLLELAYEQGCQHDLAEALFMAYFCEGRDVGDMDTLVEIAAQIGIDAGLVQTFLAGDGGLEEVRKQLARAPEVGVSGVPGYYLGGAFLLPGAQTSETMGQIISRVRSRLVGA